MFQFILHIVLLLAFLRNALALDNLIDTLEQLGGWKYFVESPLAVAITLRCGSWLMLLAASYLGGQIATQIYEWTK